MSYITKLVKLFHLPKLFLGFVQNLMSEKTEMLTGKNSLFKAVKMVTEMLDHTLPEFFFGAIL